MKTYCEFTFEAAHSVPPYSQIHGHTFVVKVTFGGETDAKYGWPVNLYEVEEFISALKGDRHRQGLDHSNLDLNPGIPVASLENISKYLWGVFKSRFPNLEEVELKRGFPGSTEGCIYRGEQHVSAVIGLAA
jgi:6-pyruvoyltetrahydropterin/6-carboxytetrahydropterin synthase